MRYYAASVAFAFCFAFGFAVGYRHAHDVHQETVDRLRRTQVIAEACNRQVVDCLGYSNAILDRLDRLDRFIKQEW